MDTFALGSDSETPKVTEVEACSTMIGTSCDTLGARASGDRVSNPSPVASKAIWKNRPSKPNALLNPKYLPPVWEAIYCKTSWPLADIGEPTRTLRIVNP